MELKEHLRGGIPDQPRSPGEDTCWTFWDSGLLSPPPLGPHQPVWEAVASAGHLLSLERAFYEPFSLNEE